MKLAKLLRPLLAPALSLCLALPAWAECRGTNIFDALPAAEQEALTAQADSAPFSRGLLFSATKGEEKITLAGTYHLPDPRHDTLVGALSKALDGASRLLVEAGPDEQGKLEHAIKTDPTLMFSTGKTLPQMMSEQDWNMTKAALAAHGMPAFLAAKMRPAFVAMTLSLPPCATAELAKGQGGLDLQVMTAAEADGVPVEALEPWDTVFKLFNGITETEALEMLRAAVIGAPLADDMGVTMGDLYFRGEPRLIWELARYQAVAAGMDAEEVERQMKLSEDLLMVARNQNWLPEIEAAAEDGPVVVAVGALHLSGEEGLLRLLEKDGWTIKRLDG